MRLRKLFCLWFLAVLVSGLSGNWTPQVKATPSSNNLIANSSFEEGSGDQAYNWTYSVTQNMSVHRVNTQHYSGSWSYEIWTNQTGYSPSGGVLSDLFNVTEGGYYDFSIWLKTENYTGGARSSCLLRVKNATAEYTVATIPTDANIGTTDWTQYKFVSDLCPVHVQIPEGYGYTQARIWFDIRAKTDNNVSIGWFDNVTFSPVQAVRIHSRSVMVAQDDLPQDIVILAKVFNTTEVTTGLTANSFTVHLDSATLTPKLASYNSTLHLWQLDVTIPVNTAVNDYAFTVTVSELECQNNRKLKVHRKTDDFFFAICTDIHLGYSDDSFHGLANWQKTVDILNVVNPDFVVVCGDIHQYHHLFDETTENLTMPVYAIVGNHDAETTTKEDNWLQYIWAENGDAQTAYSFDFGEYHFVLLGMSGDPGDISTEQYNWVEQDVIEHQTSKMTFMFMHHPLVFNGGETWSNDTRRDLVRKLIDDYNIAITFSGHKHVPKTSTFNYNSDGDNETYITIVETCNTSAGGNYDAGFGLAYVKNGAIQNTGTIYTFDYPSNVQEFFATKTSTSLNITSTYVNYTDFPVNIPYTTTPQPTFVEMDISKDYSNTLSWSFSGEKLTLTISCPSGTTSTSKVYCGSKGKPQIVRGATTWSWDENTKVATITVQHTSPQQVEVDWEAIEKRMSVAFRLFLPLMGIGVVLVTLRKLGLSDSEDMPWTKPLLSS